MTLTLEHPPVVASTLDGFTPLLRELNDLKRVRAAHTNGSFADGLFVDAWRRLLAREATASVALNVTARAVAATRLAGIDGDTLRAHGLSDAEVVRLLVTAFDDAATPIAGPLRNALRAALESSPCAATEPLPPFVGQLLRQPRAGATHPGRPRMILEPAESHGDHCLVVAVYGVLLTSRFDGDPETAFLTGLAHHLFNASLPDAGFNGDVVMDRAGVLDRVVQAAFEHAFDEIGARDPDLLERVRRALAFTRKLDPPNSKCFHAADVFDRVLEMDWFARCAAFTLGTAVHDLNIVHAAPEQAFQRQALAEAGIWDEWPAR